MDSFYKTAIRVLEYMPNVITNSNVKDNFVIHESTSANNTKFLRPINTNLFFDNPSELERAYKDFSSSIEEIKELKEKHTLSKVALNNIDSVLYTIQQSLGCGMDLMINPNSARKHIGNRLEELMRVIFEQVGITNKKVVLKIPYEHEGSPKTYKCENDLILSPYDEVKSSSSSIDKREIVLSVKTSSKDRMGKIFIDKMLLQKFVGHDVKMAGIFLNDVQRKRTDNISYTLVSGLFMVYTNFLTELEGVYYLDSPPHERKPPYDQHIHKFSKLISKDVWEMLTA